MIKLRMRLRGFQEPDTGSDFEGHVEPGEYRVEELRKNFPGADTDYARIVAPALSAGDTWICTRWKQQRYADLLAGGAAAPAPEPDFGNDELAIPESVLVELLPRFREFTYDIDEARYPFEIPGVRVPQAPPTTNNCCTFVEALLARAWADARPQAFTWSAARHRQMMIVSNDDFYSPVTAAVESGMALAVEDPHGTPRPWTVVQGWRNQWRSGHTFIIVDRHEATDRVLTLESNSAFGLDGVGCRALGNLRDLPGGRPPARWWENERLWTWERVHTIYRFLQQGVLKVTDRRWSREAA